MPDVLQCGSPETLAATGAPAHQVESGRAEQDWISAQPWLLALILSLGAVLSGCVSATEAEPADPQAISTASASTTADPVLSSPPAIAFSADVLLLGEVHDNVTQHRLRADWLRSLAASRRFALVLEQFDLGAQPALDEAAKSADDRSLATRAGFRFDAWEWSSYAPYLALARERQLPLFAGNAPAAQIMAQARSGAEVPESASRPVWSAADSTAMAHEIEVGHCGLLPSAAVGSVAKAQRLRDLAMAQAIVDAHRRTGLPVVLLAGNGHVRRDLGVPRALAATWPEARMWSVGFLERERDGPDDRAYDQVVMTPAQERQDPCGVLREKWRARPPSAGPAGASGSAVAADRP